MAATADVRPSRRLSLRTATTCCSSPGHALLHSKKAIRVKIMTEVDIEELPQSFPVKYLGNRPCRGLWGIKHTRGPVDSLVEEAKETGSGLPATLLVTRDGCSVCPRTGGPIASHPIRTISYGVQDLYYTRVFAMIVVSDDEPPFQCHAFACENRHSARRLTYCLAAAFHDYRRRVQQVAAPTKFAIDLRTPEQMATTAADSEA